MPLIKKIPYIGATSYEITDLFPGETYDFRVASIKNGIQGPLTDPVTETTVDTTAPGAPTGLTVDSFTYDDITISWSPNGESDLDGYNVYVDSVKVNSQIIVTESYFIEGLDPLTEYSITITAVDESGNESAASTAVLQTTADATPNAPTGLSSDIVAVGVLYTNDFSSYANGSKPDDWGYLFDNRYDVFIVADSEGTIVPVYGTKIMVEDPNGKDEWRKAISAPVGQLSDCETLSLVRLANPPSVEGFNTFEGLVRAFDTDIEELSSGANEFGYLWSLDGADINLGRQNPAYSKLASVAFPENLNNWFWVRFSAIGTALKVKIWEHGTSEPASWTLQATDSNLTSGAVGIGWYDKGYTAIVDYFAVSDGTTIPLPE